MMTENEDKAAVQDEYEIGRYKSGPKILQSITLPVMENLLVSFDCSVSWPDEPDIPPFMRVETSGGVTFNVNVIDADDEFVEKIDDPGRLVTMGANFDIQDETRPSIDLLDLANKWNASVFNSTACVQEGRLCLDYTILGQGIVSTQFVAQLQEWFEIISDFIRFVFEECGLPDRS
ncbi:YbjN domain-containing protein [Salipiger mucosus]|uniref:YbjN domain-containing protein n=1 Tax=Salipiger mucosus DSM 16094 TaxID=1123237 RepID=S9RVG9_9RHOB|nr:hypothetical protein [Salipiger mucosus]EPX77974.1 hypothetical protein Salmuc_03296 [Salipiger mucosus DSM 16094]